MVDICIDYTHLRNVERYLVEKGVLIEDKRYDERVTLTLAIEGGKENGLYADLTDMCMGNILINPIENKYIAYPI